MNSKKIIALFYAIFLISCNQQDLNIRELKLVEDLSIDEFDNGSYFNDIRSLAAHQDNIYLVDYSLNQVFLVDKDGKFVHAIGKPGRGPGELLGAGQMAIHNDTLYVFSDEKQDFEVYINDKYIATLSLSNTPALSDGSRFAVDAENIFISMPQTEGSISKIPLNNPQEAQVFGTMVNFSSERQTLFQNYRHIIRYKNNILSIPASLNFIERYSLNGELLEKFPYENVAFIQQRIDHARLQLHKENQVMILVSDAYVYADKLYLLTLHNENERAFCNKLLVFDLGEEQFRLNAILDLGPGWFSSICVSSDHLWTIKSNRGKQSLTRFHLGAS